LALAASGLTDADDFVQAGRAARDEQLIKAIAVSNVEAVNTLQYLQQGNMVKTTEDAYWTWKVQFYERYDDVQTPGSD
jgi:hypothetical protein